MPSETGVSKFFSNSHQHEVPLSPTWEDEESAGTAGLLEEEVELGDVRLFSSPKSNFNGSSFKPRWMRSPAFGANKHPLLPKIRVHCHSKLLRGFLKFICIILGVTLGGLAYTSLTIALSPHLARPSPDPFDKAFATFRASQEPISPLQPSYPDEFFRSVLPVPCNSHNDYWRRTPLYAALGSGCISVEADVWLIDNDLYVGHTRDQLHPEKTLQRMYITPLIWILEKMNSGNEVSGDPLGLNGVFHLDPMQSLTLLIDMKNYGLEAWSHVNLQLQPLRERGWLTHWNGSSRIERPVTVVVSGNAPFELVIANKTYRDIFFDAPLNALIAPSDPVAPLVPASSLRTNSLHPSWPNRLQELQAFRYNPSNSHLASARFGDAVGTLWHSSLSRTQIEVLQKQIRQARERGLLPRYWSTPRWPRGLRDQVWAVLIQEDIGLLNVDDLRAVRKDHWGVWPQGQV